MKYPFLYFKEEGCREAVNVGEGDAEADVEVVQRDSSSEHAIDGNPNISSSVPF